MQRRYLVGPISSGFSANDLEQQRQAGHCLTFGPADGNDLTIAKAEGWEELSAKLPADWRPDFLVMPLWYTTIPQSFWNAPIPIIGLAADWNLLWHYYRHLLQDCDLVLTDAMGVERMLAQGISDVRYANLYGCIKETLNHEWSEGPRDIDILFVGNLHPAVQRDRLPWLSRLSRFADRWNVQIYQGVFGQEYRNLLGRARIVFNRGIRKECNLRVFEAMAAGALLFQEEENPEVHSYLREGEECVYYREDNLESLLERYLTSEDERNAVARQAKAKVRDYSFEKFWNETLANIDQAWHELTKSCQKRCATACEAVW
jgi:hypothetical protein